MFHRKINNMKVYLRVLTLSCIYLLTNAQSLQGPPDTGTEFIDQPVEPLRPYSFAWSASRHYDGVPDREHREERGEDGITRGVFRYVDPRKEIQEVVYLADKFGFHVQASNLPRDTNAVKAAKAHHQNLYEQIAAEHAQIDQFGGQLDPSKFPLETKSVSEAKVRHLSLFEKIAAEHQRIGQERALLEEQANF